jgi:hypothetical protein
MPHSLKARFARQDYYGWEQKNSGNGSAAAENDIYSGNVARKSYKNVMEK